MIPLDLLVDFHVLENISRVERKTVVTQTYF